jgi:hypothetical protein
MPSRFQSFLSSSQAQAPCQAPCTNANVDRAIDALRADIAVSAYAS